MARGTKHHIQGSACTEFTLSHALASRLTPAHPRTPRESRCLRVLLLSCFFGSFGRRATGESAWQRRPRYRGRGMVTTPQLLPFERIRCRKARPDEHVLAKVQVLEASTLSRKAARIWHPSRETETGRTLWRNHPRKQ